MVDDSRIRQWEHEARDALATCYGTSKPEGHLAAVVLALLRDRESLLAFLERLQASQAHS
jgi:hypothetical protein